MRARTPSLLVLPLAIAIGACAGGDLFGTDGQTETVDLLVIPPDGSLLPAQVVPSLSFSTLQAGDFDLQLGHGRTLEGLVVGTDGAPLMNATVRITMQGAGLDSTRVTDTAGRIAVPLGQGVYDVEVTPDPLAHYGIPPRIFRNVEVPEGEVQLPYLLPMPPGIAIRGSVLAPTPKEGWRVSARRADTSDPGTWADTTIAGYEIFVSSTGDWIVQVTPPNGTGFPIAQKLISVPPEGMTLSFQYDFFPLRAITGQVTALGIDPAPSTAGITLRARATLPSADPTITYTFDQRTTTDADGFFDLPVLAGIYALSVEPPIDSALSHRIIQSVDVSTADVVVDPAQTQLHPTVDLIGRVLASETQQGTSGARVALVAADGTSYTFTDRSASGGAYQMTIDLGAYSVLVLPNGDSGLVRHVQSLEVTSETASVDFALQGGLKLGGRVLSPENEPIANVTVMALRSADKTPVGSAEWLTETDGRWVLTLPLVP